MNDPYAGENLGRLVCIETRSGPRNKRPMGSVFWRDNAAALSAIQSPATLRLAKTDAALERARLHTLDASKRNVIVDSCGHS